MPVNPGGPESFLRIVSFLTGYESASTLQLILLDQKINYREVRKSRPLSYRSRFWPSSRGSNRQSNGQRKNDDCFQRYLLWVNIRVE